MSRFYRVKFDSIYLSSDGTISGIPAKLQVNGASELLSNFTGSVIQAVDGTPVVQIFETGSKGKTLEIKIETHIYTALWNSIVALINTALENSVSINVVGVGDIGDFNVDALPLLPRPFEAEGFENGRILKPIFRFITV